MLLRLGAAMMLLSLVLAAGVAVVTGLRGKETPSIATLSSTESRAAEITATKENKFDPGKKLEIEEPRQEEPPPEPPREKPKLRPEPVARGEKPKPPAEKYPPQQRGAGAEPISRVVGPLPKNSEVSRAEEPRYFDPWPGSVMTLTVEALGLYDVPVISSDSLQALDTSLMHVPETSLPWDSSAHRNVYISGHYLGWPETASRLVFYNLDKLQNGDEVILKDRGGNIYRYQVSESFSAWPEDSWVMGQEVGRDMLTLQTCIPPTFAERLVVRADRV